MSAPPITTSLVDTTVDGKYRILGLLGEGGMGAVYAAEHLGTGRPVAVKVILPQLLGNPEAVERFRREARAAGGLRHPNIVDVTDFGVSSFRSSELAYLVMEYLEGMTLRALMDARGALPVDLVVAIVEQIALALEAAHNAGVVHRDLKPDNIWLVPDPRGGYVVRVLDFGIAKLRDDQRASSDVPAQVSAAFADRPPLLLPVDDEQDVAETVARPVRLVEQQSSIVSQSIATASSHSITVAGSTLGTPAYMSPEQCRGTEADARSDIYSLGVITYEALSGRRPFKGTFQELVTGHIGEQPERLDRIAAVSGRVADAVARALAKRPEDRYPTARAMAGSLYAAAEGASVILRRAIALYSDRLGLFLRISASAFVPSLVIIIPVLIAAALGARGAVPAVLLGSVFAWGVVTLITNAAFAATIERLRNRPLMEVRVRDVFDDVKEKLGLSRQVGIARACLRLVWFYLRAELGAPAGAGDLAFLIAFLEGRPFDQVPERCKVLARGPKESYNWIKGVLIGAILAIPLVQGCVIFSLLTLLRAPHAADVATTAAVALIPVNAVFLNPVFSVALALLYFRARQANGEDVALSSVIAARL